MSHAPQGRWSRFCVSVFRLWFVTLPLLSIGLLPTPSMAQVKTYAEEYDKRIKGAETIKAETSELFGDKTNLATGETEFLVTDVSIPGNNALPVAIERHFSVEARGGRWNEYLFGDWDIGIPYIGGVFAQMGWQGLSTTPPYVYNNNRCSQGAAPPTFRPQGASIDVEAWEYWHGYHLVTPDGSQEMLQSTSYTRPQPTDGKVHPWVTSQYWYFSCLPTLKSGDPGEGFIAQSPDGTRYYFDWMVRLPYASILKPSKTLVTSSHNGDPRLTLTNTPVPRQEIRIYPTRIEDARGNWVQYAWDGGKLMQITASDGRALTLTYRTVAGQDRVGTASDGSRTWTYAYDPDGSLISVTLPDQSAWSINFKPLDRQGLGYDDTYQQGTVHPVYDKSLNCSWMRVLKNNDSIGTIQHPSGAVGTFEFDAVRHGRTFVRPNCHTPQAGDGGNADIDLDFEDLQMGSSSSIPARFDVMAIKSKSISGPGLPTYAWNFSYATPIGCFVDYCKANSETTKTTTTIDPEGVRTIYTYGVQFEVNDGQLLKKEVYKDGVLLQVSANTYLANADAGHQSFAEPVGQSPEGENGYFSERNRPQIIRSLTQDGITSTSTVNGFDAFAKATSVTKSNLWYHRTDITSYYDDTAKWVIGQVAKVTNVDTNKVVSQTDYEATTALPSRTYSFGKLQASMTYYGDGTLQTATDGNQKTTTLSNWKRGLPQIITFADNTTKSSVIDDLGLIRSLTDENGFVTTYDYDAMGRMTALTPPQGNAIHQAFVQVQSVENGLAPGHWRQTITSGSGKKTSYFDALWRPVATQEEDVQNSQATSRGTVTRYDSNGRTVFASYPRNPQTDGGLDYGAAMPGTTTIYDGLGRVRSITQDSELGPLVTTTEYLSGVQTRVTNPRKFTTTTGYFFLEEPRYDQPVWIVAPEGTRTDIGRDVFGAPLSVTRGMSTN